MDIRQERSTIHALMQRFTIEIATDGNNEIVNLNPEVSTRLRDIKGDGLVHLFVVGSTAASSAAGIWPEMTDIDVCSWPGTTVSTSMPRRLI